MQKLIVTFLLVFLFFSCKRKQKADLIFISGQIYTMQENQPIVEAIAIRDGRILDLGKNSDILDYKNETTKIVDLQNQFMMPALIEGHGHFLQLGEQQQNIQLLHTHSWQEIIDSVKQRVALTSSNQWIKGKGWHQEKWTSKNELRYAGYPYHDQLSAISPDNPVILYHASGHALIANQRAMQLANINSESLSPAGGRIIKDAEGKLTGVFEENAMSLIEDVYNKEWDNLNEEEKLEKIKRKAKFAENEALHYGISFFQDAGSTVEEIKALKNLCETDQLKIALYLMLYSNKDVLTDLKMLPIQTTKPEQFICHAVKSYLDGALGSHGAWLIDPYADDTSFHGQITTPIASLKLIAEACAKNKLQFCVHAIGDQANREVLNIYEEMQKKYNLNDHRWRIEHAQHINPMDIPRFHRLSVIASMQAIHCTSDAPFVEKRLGKERAMHSSYPWRSLIDAQAQLANGTDVPVESINPFECIYAACTRCRWDNGFCFYPEEKMTRTEALKSYTIWNAYAAKQEILRGSIEKNKLADLIVLDRNLMTCKDKEILETRVLELYIKGQKIQ